MAGERRRPRPAGSREQLRQALLQGLEPGRKPRITLEARGKVGVAHGVVALGADGRDHHAGTDGALQAAADAQRYVDLTKLL